MTREEAIGILDEVIPPPEHHTVDLDHLPIAQAWRCIKETLTAEPTERGRWIGIDDFPHETWECSRCGKIIETDTPPHYCENCGKRMDK